MDRQMRRATLAVVAFLVMIAAPARASADEPTPEPTVEVTQPPKPDPIKRTIITDLAAYCDTIDWREGTQIIDWIWDGAAWVKGPAEVVSFSKWKHRATTPSDIEKYQMSCSTPEEKEFGKRPTNQKDLGQQPLVIPDEVTKLLQVMSIVFWWI